MIGNTNEYMTKYKAFLTKISFWKIIGTSTKPKKKRLHQTVDQIQDNIFDLSTISANTSIIVILDKVRSIYWHLQVPFIQRNTLILQKYFSDPQEARALKKTQTPQRERNKERSQTSKTKCKGDNWAHQEITNEANNVVNLTECWPLKKNTSSGTFHWTYKIINNNKFQIHEVIVWMELLYFAVSR